MVHLQPVAYTVRFYEEGGSFEAASPFIGVCTVQVVGRQTIYVSAMHSDTKMTRRHLQIAADMFYALGYRWSLQERKGRIVQKKIERYTAQKKTPVTESKVT